MRQIVTFWEKPESFFHEVVVLKCFIAKLFISQAVRLYFLQRCFSEDSLDVSLLEIVFIFEQLQVWFELV